jgi:hypothetical protein
VIVCDCHIRTATIIQDATLVSSESQWELYTRANYVSRYQTKLAQRPLLTQSVTTAVSYTARFFFILWQWLMSDSTQVLFAAGDTLAQQAVERKGFANHDLARSGRMALYGGGMKAWYFS